VAGFYEYHHYKNKAYPFYISKKDDEPLMLAGLWSEWLNHTTGERVNSCSIVTTRANPLMAKIHNNPKLKEPRMPLILSTTIEDKWLNYSDRKDLEDLLIPFPDNELKAHTVQKLSGKESLGNVPKASEYYAYKELSESIL